MDTLHIKSGRITLSVNGDSSRLVSFDPEDVAFVTGFYTLLGRFAQKGEEYSSMTASLNPKEQQAVEAAAQKAKELLRWLMEEIDNLFGEGTCLAAFGETCSPAMLRQFFEGIAPYVRSVREKKLAQYAEPHSGALQ